MKKTWFVLPGYCVGLTGLLLITYRTLLAISSPEKSILVSVNRFGEQYLDLVCLVFLWVVCLVGLLCLSSWVNEMSRRERSKAGQTRKGVLGSPLLSFDVLDSFHQPSGLTLMEDVGEGFYTAEEATLIMDETAGSVSVSIVIQQEDSQG
jgi:hypothetical protein